MKELDLLKKDWNKTNNNYTTVSATEISEMLQKKSSSIVKKLFYISVVELLFWLAISMIPSIFSSSMKERMDTIESSNTLFFNVLTVFTFGVSILFVYLLYKAYQKIANTNSIKILMQNIINTRKIIKYYVLYNLTGIFISIMLGLIFSFNEDPELLEKITQLNNSQLLITFGIILITIIGFLLLIWFFYKILYGFLIHKLNINYNELKKIN